MFTNYPTLTAFTYNRYTLLFCNNLYYMYTINLRIHEDFYSNPMLLHIELVIDPLNLLTAVINGTNNNSAM